MMDDGYAEIYASGPKRIYEIAFKCHWCIPCFSHPQFKLWKFKKKDFMSTFDSLQD